MFWVYQIYHDPRSLSSLHHHIHVCVCVCGLATSEHRADVLYPSWLAADASDWRIHPESYFPP